MRSDIYMSLLNKTGVQPDWIQRYDIASINFEDVRFRGELGEGMFGSVTNGEVYLEGGMK